MSRKSSFQRSTAKSTARRVTGATTTAAAATAFGLFWLTPAPQANADIEDLFEPVIDALSGSGVADTGTDLGTNASSAIPDTDLANSIPGLDSVNPLAASDPSSGFGASLDADVQSFINSSFGQQFDSIINYPFTALFGRA